MLTLGISSLLLGMAMGQRFKVLVVVPAVALALVALLGLGIAQTQSSWSIALQAVVSAASLQIGYFAGTVLQQALIAARASRLRAGKHSEAPAARRLAR